VSLTVVLSPMTLVEEDLTEQREAVALGHASQELGHPDRSTADPARPEPPATSKRSGWSKAEASRVSNCTRSATPGSAARARAMGNEGRVDVDPKSRPPVLGGPAAQGFPLSTAEAEAEDS
jgi:hypothetical protein